MIAEKSHPITRHGPRLTHEQPLARNHARQGNRSHMVWRLNRLARSLFRPRFPNVLWNRVGTRWLTPRANPQEHGSAEKAASGLQHALMHVHGGWLGRMEEFTCCFYFSWLEQVLSILAEAAKPQRIHQQSSCTWIGFKTASTENQSIPACSLPPFEMFPIYLQATPALS